MEFLLCTDGFYGLLEEEEIYQVEASKEQIKEWVQKLFSESKKKRRIRQSVLCDRQSSEQEIGKIYHQRYQVRKILGEGGMGKVFLALDQKTGKEVAVKIVKDQKQWDRGEGDVAKIKHTKVCRNYFCRKGKGTFSGDGIYSWKFVKTIWQCLWKTL